MRFTDVAHHGNDAELVATPVEQTAGAHLHVRRLVRERVIQFDTAVFLTGFQRIDDQAGKIRIGAEQGGIRLPDNVWVVDPGTPKPLETGQFISWVADGRDRFTTRLSSQTGTEKLIGGYSYVQSVGWWIFSVNYYHYVTLFARVDKTFDNVSVKADYPVRIEFIGHDEGSVTISSSGRSVTLTR